MDESYEIRRIDLEALPDPNDANILRPHVPAEDPVADAQRCTHLLDGQKGRRGLLGHAGSSAIRGLVTEVDRWAGLAPLPD